MSIKLTINNGKVLYFAEVKTLPSKYLKSILVDDMVNLRMEYDDYVIKNLVRAIKFYENILNYNNADWIDPQNRFKKEKNLMNEMLEAAKYLGLDKVQLIIKNMSK